MPIKTTTYTSKEIEIMAAYDKVINKAKVESTPEIEKFHEMIKNRIEKMKDEENTVEENNIPTELKNIHKILGSIDKEAKYGNSLKFSSNEYFQKLEKLQEDNNKLLGISKTGKKKDTGFMEKMFGSGLLYKGIKGTTKLPEKIGRGINLLANPSEIGGFKSRSRQKQITESQKEFELQNFKTQINLKQIEHLKKQQKTQQELNNLEEQVRLITKKSLKDRTDEENKKINELEYQKTVNNKLSFLKEEVSNREIKAKESAKKLTEATTKEMAWQRSIEDPGSFGRQFLGFKGLKKGRISKDFETEMVKSDQEKLESDLLKKSLFESKKYKKIMEIPEIVDDKITKQSDISEKDKTPSDVDTLLDKTSRKRRILSRRRVPLRSGESQTISPLSSSPSLLKGGLQTISPVDKGTEFVNAKIASVYSGTKPSTVGEFFGSIHTSLRDLVNMGGIKKEKEEPEEEDDKSKSFLENILGPIFGTGIGKILSTIGSGITKTVVPAIGTGIKMLLPSLVAVLTSPLTVGLAAILGVGALAWWSEVKRNKKLTPEQKQEEFKYGRAGSMGFNFWDQRSSSTGIKEKAKDIKTPEKIETDKTNIKNLSDLSTNKKKENDINENIVSSETENDLLNLKNDANKQNPISLELATPSNSFITGKSTEVTQTINLSDETIAAITASLGGKFDYSLNG